MEKKCEIEGCNKNAVERFDHKWLCREHLCPDETLSFLMWERENYAGLKSNGIQFESTPIEPLEFHDLDDNWYIFPDNETSASPPMIHNATK